MRYDCEICTDFSARVCVRYFVQGIEVLEPGSNAVSSLYLVASGVVGRDLGALDQLELEEYEIAEQNATLRREESEKFDLEAEVERILLAPKP
eukprot:190094-Rhodomonas_salina.1